MSDQKVFEELYAENNPVLRGEVRSALKKRGVTKINPFALEFALKFGHSEYSVKKHWFEKKNRLHARLRQTLNQMAEAPPEEWADYVGDIINSVLRIDYSWRSRQNPLSLTEVGIQLQPHPKSFLQALKKGADPKEVLLSMCNIWMGKEIFIRCANALGNDILLWDDERNLSWREWKKDRPQNQNLCEEIFVQPAGLVAVEPFTIDADNIVEYDIYGSVIADVTSFVVSFKPKEGVEPDLLRRHVDKAVRDFVEKGRQAFRAPTCRYTNPKNAYDRPCAMHEEEFFSVRSVASGLVDALRQKYPDLTLGYEGKHFDEGTEDRDKYIAPLTNTEDAIADFMQGLIPKKPLPPEIVDYLQEYKGFIDIHYHTSLDDNGVVKIKKALIFDDVLELYKFCDGFLTPTAAVAQSLNAARFSEECGPVKTPGGLSELDDGYLSKNMDFADRLGNLADVHPREVIDRAQHDILIMLGEGQSTLLTAFHQVATLAHGTLAGLLPDGTGLYPSLRQIADRTNEYSVAEENDLLPERMRHMMERMAIRFNENKDRDSLQDRFMRAAKTATELARHQEKIDAICSKYEGYAENFGRQSSSRPTNTFDVDKRREKTLADERARALDCVKRHVDYEPKVSLEILIGKLLGGEKNPDFSTDGIKGSEPPPPHLDTLGRYMWWQALNVLQDTREAEMATSKNPTRKKSTQHIGVRSNVANWGGEIGVQLPRGFKGSNYITRNRHTPFARPGTELPRELEDFIRKGPDRQKGLALPDPSEFFSGPK